MKSLRRAAGLSRLLLLACALNSGAGQAQERLALVGGTLIDGSGAQPLRNSVVLIEGERVALVGSVGRTPIPEGYQVLSTEGMTVLPGLWDPHVHLLYSGHPDFNHWFRRYSTQFREQTMPTSARQLLLAGVTSARDLAAPLDDLQALRAGLASGELQGATIYGAGPALVPAALATRPHLLGVQGPEDAAAKTQQLIDAGVDFIKFMGASSASLEELRAVVATAHAAGLRVTAHGRSDDEIRVGLLAGVDEFQHIGSASPQFPQDILDAIGARIASGQPLYWSPTLGVDLNADELAADPEFLEDPRNFVGLGAEIEADVRQAIAAATFSARSPEVIDSVKRKLQQLIELGVIFVSGSDMGTFGHPASEATWRDLEAWVFEIGMDPLVAIKWATLDAARYMGVAEDVGSVTPGKRADLIAVRGSPLRHWSVLRDPLIVIKNGTRVK